MCQAMLHMSPTLFNIVLYDIVQKAMQNAQEIFRGEGQLTDLDFADDNSLLSNSHKTWKEASTL